MATRGRRHHRGSAQPDQHGDTYFTQHSNLFAARLRHRRFQRDIVPCGRRGQLHQARQAAAADPIYRNDDDGQTSQSHRDGGQNSIVEQTEPNGDQ
ncbi:hypothetical protein ISF_04237 [Cordyceps fumosorosea ARSEF 2679]|uniref:Uncharacterized protein n=1 Tax=Cordyceps fumosorosea (strain ARSEF 2679) TaxID=1081104 RepID=A0A167XD30_CORFA|nr:hypothetical protein ISF_04237 [Cordyceps fumosorosea ARSEF 2679]OAA64827.1 hypothetical protein ISF_04237 [Cordyceps fumosorosea ARSEF 2679]